MIGGGANPASAAPRAMWTLLAAAFLVGLAHILLLPPFEGVDETAHYSYVEQLAAGKGAPMVGQARLARDLDFYPGPMTNGDAIGRLTYRSYRAAGAPPLAGGPAPFAPGPTANWQAQHPPLYYMALLPAFALAKSLDWKGAIFVLRLQSWLFAFAGLAIGVLATAWLAPQYGPWSPAIMAAWPFLFPQFFPEMARIGNDSFCLLILGGAWAALLRLLPAQSGRPAVALVLGALLGAGLLTKAFFLAILAGVAVLLAWRIWRRRTPAAAIDCALALGAAALIGFGWYLAKLHETGSFTGAQEFIAANKSHDLAHAFFENLSWRKLAWGLGTIPATFVWVGSWSMARFPEALLAPLIVLAALPLAEWARRLPRADAIGWAPLAIAAPLLAGLLYHKFLWIAGYSVNAGGWYLHILAAPVGFAVAQGWTRPRTLGLLTAYAAFYAGAAWAFQLSFFSGCAAKDSRHHYDLSNAACFIDMKTLGALAFPWAGLAFLALGAGAALAAGAMAWRGFQTESGR